MGTHPIFESDFDCLTEMALRLSQPVLGKYIGNANKINIGGSSGIFGNVGAGRHYDPTKHMTLEEMKRKSMLFQDVYLDGLENHALADRNRMQILPNNASKKLRWFRTAYLNQRFYTWIFWLSMLGFTVFYNLTTFRWFGVGSMVNNLQKEYSESKRAAREADAIENCAEYIPALLAGYQKLQAPSNLDAWTNYEPKNEWKKIE